MRSTAGRFSSGRVRAALALAGCGKDRSASSRVRFGIAASAVAVCTAAAHGLFTREGLDVELVQIQSGPAAVAATVAGLARFHLRRFPRLGCGPFQRFQELPVVAPANGNGNFAILVQEEITKPSDLIGKWIRSFPRRCSGLSVRLWLRQLDRPREG